MESSSGKLVSEFALLFAKLEELPAEERQNVLGAISGYVSPQKVANVKRPLYQSDTENEDDAESAEKATPTRPKQARRASSFQDGDLGTTRKGAVNVVQKSSPYFGGPTRSAINSNLKTEEDPLNVFRTYSRKRRNEGKVQTVSQHEEDIDEAEQKLGLYLLDASDPGNGELDQSGEGNDGQIAVDEPELEEDKEMVFTFGVEEDSETDISQDGEDYEDLTYAGADRASESTAEDKSTSDLRSDRDATSPETYDIAPAKKRKYVRKKRNAGNLVCDVPDCGFLAKYPSRLAVHMAKHTGAKNFVCEVCSNAFSQKSTLTQHMKWHDTLKLQCKECSFEAANMRSLIQHRWHEHRMRNNTVCEICGQVLDTAQAYAHHKRSVHFSCTEEEGAKTKTQKVLVACPVCDKEVGKSFLKSHMEQHVDSGPHVCGICDKAFTVRRYLASHVRLRHHERTFSCAICNKHFESLAKLQRHEFVHSQIKPYGCPFCSYRASVKDNVCKHVRTKHGVVDFTTHDVLIAKSIIKTPIEGTLMEVYDENDGELMVIPKRPERMNKRVEAPVEYVLQSLHKVAGRPVTVEEMKKRETEKRRLVAEKRRIQSQIFGAVEGDDKEELRS